MEPWGRMRRRPMERCTLRRAAAAQRAIEDIPTIASGSSPPVAARVRDGGSISISNKSAALMTKWKEI